MIYGYAWVSTDSQDLGDHAAQPEIAVYATSFRETMKGSYVDRPELTRVMARFATGDVMVIPAVLGPVLAISGASVPTPSGHNL